MYIRGKTLCLRCRIVLLSVICVYLFVIHWLFDIFKTPPISMYFVRKNGGNRDDNLISKKKKYIYIYKSISKCDTRILDVTRRPVHVKTINNQLHQGKSTPVYLRDLDMRDTGHMTQHGKLGHRRLSTDSWRKQQDQKGEFT